MFRMVFPSIIRSLRLYISIRYMLYGFCGCLLVGTIWNWNSSSISFPLASIYRTCMTYRLRLKCDSTHAETRFRLSAKLTSPYKSAGASVQSTIGSRGVRISGSNAGYTMFRGSVKGIGYPLYSSVSPSLPLPCVTVCHDISAGLYLMLLYSLRLLMMDGKTVRDM